MSKSPFSRAGLFIWGLSVLFFLYEFFLRSSIGSIAHQIIPALHLNPKTFALMGSAYYLVYAAMQIPAGMLIDKYGVRFILTTAVFVCAGATLLFSQSTHFTVALISRSLLALGSSFAFIGLLVVVVNWFPKRYFSFFSGVSQFIGTMGPLLAAGPLIGFMNSYQHSWRFTFVIISVFGFTLAILMALTIKNKSQRTQRKLIYLNLPSLGKTSLLKSLKSSQTWYIAFYSATVYVSIELLGAMWGTEYLQARGFTQNTAANIISFAWFGYAVGCPLVGFLSDRSNRRKSSLVCCAFLGLFSTLCALFPKTQAAWFYATTFFTLGIAAAGQNVGFALMAENTSARIRAASLGLNNAAITLFNALIPLIIGYFIFTSSHGLPMQSLKPEHFGGFIVLPILYCIAILLSLLFIRETFGKSQHEPMK